MRVFAAAVVIGAVGTGCETDRFEESTTETVRVEVSAPPQIEIRVDEGQVRVVGARSSDPGETGSVEVTFESRARAADRASARALLDNVRTEAVRDGDTLRISARSHPAGQVLVGGGVSTEVTVRMPSASARLDVRIDEGSISIERVSGTIDAETGDGRVDVDRVDGTIKLRSQDGSITGTSASGDIDVLSEDGRIRLDGSFAVVRAVTADGSIRVRADAEVISDAWTLRASDGSIELSLPPSIGAELEASTSDGRIVNELSGFTGTNDRARVKGTLGSGGPRILITTMDGRIVLKDR